MHLVGCEELVCWCCASWEAGGEVEEVLEEDFDGGEARGSGCGEFRGELVDPGTLLVLIRDRRERGVELTPRDKLQIAGL